MLIRFWFSPAAWLASVLIVFAVIITTFFLYDRRVEQRQHVVLTSAVRSNNVVSDVFPAHLRDRLMEEEAKKREAAAMTKSRSSRKGNLKQFLNDGSKGEHLDVDDSLRHSKPLADLYLNTTVLTAEIVGFTGAYHG